MSYRIGLSLVVAISVCFGQTLSSPPAFRFLGKNKPLAPTKLWMDTLDAHGEENFTWSFRADFDKLLAMARPELTRLGYREKWISKGKLVFFERGKTLEERGQNFVALHRGKRAFPNGDEGYKNAKGWVVVSVYRPKTR